MSRGSFVGFANQYGNNITNMVMLKSRYESITDGNLYQMVLLHKLEKHLKNNNARSAALYLAMYIQDRPEYNLKLPERAKEIAIQMKLKTNGKMVGYLHDDQTYHWF